MTQFKTWLPINITGDWEITVDQGSLNVAGKDVTVSKSIIKIPSAPTRTVRNEKHQTFPIFNAEARGYAKGRNLNHVNTAECSATGVLIEASVSVKFDYDGQQPLKRGVDYEFDGLWGTFGRLEGGQIKNKQPIYVDYDYVPCRLDSIVVTDQGEVKLVSGRPEVGRMYPPEISDTEKVIANVYLNGVMDKLTDENFFPIQADLKPFVSDSNFAAETLLPKTLAKLRNGEPITYVAWGDSVTEAAYLADIEKTAYHFRFAEELRKRFPKSQINHFVAGWGGQNSIGYMAEPAGGVHDFVRECIDRKPDLVTIEFVNDAFLDEAGVEEQYTKIKTAFDKVGSELVLITPHFVRPDWMELTSLKVDDDPRKYVKGLHEFAVKNNIALADAAKYWGQLWRKGIPNIVLQDNSINHPDERGHQIFLDALMELFPEK